MSENKRNRLLVALSELKKFLGDENSLNEIQSLENKLKQLEFSSPVLDESDYVIYTDGACRGNPGPGAYAFLVENKSGERILEGASVDVQTTNNRMELMGVIAGLTEIKNSSKIRVVTDSKYVVDGITKWVPGWKSRGWKKADKKAPENIELWQSLDELVLRLNPSFEWVKGHSGHEQNEYVDRLANEALDDAGF